MERLLSVHDITGKWEKNGNMPLGSGVYSSVEPILFQADGYRIPLVKRVPRSHRSADEWLQMVKREREMWLNLKQAGVRVIPTLLINDSEPAMYLNDLSRLDLETFEPVTCEQNMVLSVNNKSKWDEEIKARRHHKQPESRLTNMPELWQDLFSIAHNCATAGYAISDRDAILFIVQHDYSRARALAGNYKHFSKSHSPQNHTFDGNVGFLHLMFTERMHEVLGIAPSVMEEAVRANKSAQHG